MSLILNAVRKPKSLETSSPQAYSCRGSPRVTPLRVLSFPSGRTLSSGPGLTLWGIAQTSARSHPQQRPQIMWNFPYCFLCRTHSWTHLPSGLRRMWAERFPCAGARGLSIPRWTSPESPPCPKTLRWPFPGQRGAVSAEGLAENGGMASLASCGSSCWMQNTAALVRLYPTLR